MTLYIGDTAVSPVAEVPVPEKKYGVSINNLLATVDDDGGYFAWRAEPFTPDLSAIKYVGRYGLGYKFYRSTVVGHVVVGVETLDEPKAMEYCFASPADTNFGVESVSFPNLTIVSGSNALEQCFYGAPCISIEVPKLAKVAGSFAMSYCFSDTDVEDIVFPALTTLSGSDAISNCFWGCKYLKSALFPVLADITGPRAMASCFRSCKLLPSISFPALSKVAADAFGGSTYNYIFRDCPALTEIHFRADAQATIEAMTGYSSKWGATNATIYFDL